MLQHDENTRMIGGFKVANTYGRDGIAADTTIIGNLKDLSLEGLADLSAAVDRLPLAEKVQAYDPEGRAVKGQFFIRQAGTPAGETPATYAGVGSRYHVVQHQELLHPVLDAAQELGHQVHVAGNVGLSHDGARARSLIVIGDKDRTIQPLGDHSSPILAAFLAESRHDGTAGLSFRPAYVRTLCSNLNLWAEVLPNAVVGVRHTTSAQERLAVAMSGLEAVLEGVPSLAAQIQEAAERRLPPVEVGLALLGGGVSQRDLAKWHQVRDQAGRGVEAPGSAWYGSQEVTWYATHQAPNPDKADAFMKVADRIVKGGDGLSEIVAKGRLIADDLKHRRAQAEKKGGRMTIAAIPGITV